jgi:hypothetical protein
MVLGGRAELVARRLALPNAATTGWLLVQTPVS